MDLGNILGTNLDFGPIAQRARTQFQQQTIPSIAERFTALGAQNSSAFPQALGQAGAGLEEGLAGLESQFGLQKLGALQGLLNLGLAPQFETVIHPAQQSGIANLLAPLLGALGMGAGTYLGGGIPQLAGLAGQGIGGLASLFGGRQPGAY